MAAERVLDDIIALEKSLQEQVDQEKERIRAWREQERSQLEPLLEATDRSRAESIEQTLAEAREKAGRQIEKQRQAARQHEKELAALTDDFLRGVMRTRLKELLPGEDDDRPDGQG